MAAPKIRAAMCYVSWCHVSALGRERLLAVLVFGPPLLPPRTPIEYQSEHQSRGHKPSARNWFKSFSDDPSHQQGGSNAKHSTNPGAAKLHRYVRFGSKGDIL